MKAFLALEVRKSVSNLAFVFSKSDFLGLVDFDFLNLAEFATVDKFLILSPTLPPSTLTVALGAS